MQPALFIVFNPNGHYVTVEYAPPETSMPVVIGRSLFDTAAREFASRCAVPVIENAALAEDLFANVSTYQRIPDRYHGAIADALTTATGTGAYAA